MRLLSATLLIALLSMSACGDSDGPADTGPADASDTGTTDTGTADSGGSGFAGAYIEDSCAPDDGAAVELTLYDSLSDACVADSIAQTLSIYVWDTAFPIPPGTTITSAPLDGGLAPASATLCLGGTAPCLTSNTLTITFDEYVQDDHASGSYSVTFDGDIVEAGTFVAPWCAGDVLCG